DDELTTTQQINEANRSSPDRDFVRTLYGSFVLKGPYGDHVCSAYWPERQPVNFFQRRYREASSGKEFFTVPILTAYFKPLLKGVRYLHRDCHVIHTDLILSNILFTMEDPKTLLLGSEKYVSENPAARKTLPDHEIYVSGSDFRLWVNRKVPTPVVSDFGNAVRGDQVRAITASSRMCIVRQKSALDSLGRIALIYGTLAHWYEA
ncbi:uncharacterized protein BT62DRAFT_1052195, partial [Guyanagaster necrorhizus]